MNYLKKITENMAYAILSFAYSLVGKELTKEQWETWAQFIGFAVVGVSNFLVNYVVYAVFLKVFHWNYHGANIIAFIVSVYNSFYWNNKYVFKVEEGEKRTWWKVLLRTYASYAFSGLLLTEILLYIEISVLGLPELLGPVINLFITTPINFVINKFWAFKEDAQ